MSYRAAFMAAFLMLTFSALPASADQKLSFNGGYFFARGEDARVSDDVLIANLDDLLFEVNDFNGGTFGAEWLFDLGERVEVGVGTGYYARTVPSVYERLVHEDGSEIEQDLKLRIVPITALVRIFPVGQNNGFQPYIGGGLGVFNYRYSETGDFVDAAGDIFRERFVADGNATGPIVVGGLRVGNGSRFTVGGEFRYQQAKGDLGEGFLTDTVDLGGYSALFTLQVGF